ncbi:energy transducer TonB [Hymenobacter bucti]|uniref:Energy transducer TonB n=1 Tax=Hymenobacter bucti TaxID=1844114 RepID=A0ABW4R2Q4_9BACT
MDYLYCLLACAVYLALIGGLPRLLAEETLPLLRWLHWGSSVLCLLALVVPALTLGSWTFRSLGLFCAVLLGSGLLAGVRRRLQVTRVPLLATTQAVLVGLAAPVLLGLSLDSTSSEVAYTDGSYTVTVKEGFSLMDNDPVPAELELYRSRLLFFDQYLGHIGRDNLYEPLSALKARWQAVSAISFEADSNRGVAWQAGVAVPFGVNPPYHRGDQLPRAAESAPPLTRPAAMEAEVSEFDRVYTYVEEMPHLPGTVGLEPVAQAIHRRLVVPPRTQEGRVFVQLTVSETGDIQNIRLLKGVNAAVDAAVLTAVRRLPRFEPGRQNRRPVKVSLTVPITVRRRQPGKPYPREFYVKPPPVSVAPTVPDLSGLSPG